MAEVGSAYLSIMPSFKGGSKKIAKQLDGKGVGRQVGNDVGTGVASVAKKAFAPLAAALSAAAVGAFIKGTITAAGDLEQSIGAVDSVFRDSAGQIHEWAKSADTSVGLSQNAFSQSASVIGAMLTNYGVAGDKVASSTNDIIGYGADLAAMFGGTTEEAVSALGAALRGEADPAERFGLSLNKTQVSAHMAATGITNQADATLDLIKTQLEASGAMGQFAREGDTLQGAQQRLAAGWTNIKASIGNLFLPAAAAATGALAGMLPTIQRVVDGLLGFQTLLAGGGFSASIREAFGFEEDSPVVAFVSSLGESFRDAGGGFDGLLAAAQTAFSSLVDWLSTGGIESILDGLLAGRERLFAAAMELFPVVLDAVMEILPEVVDWVAGTMIPKLVDVVTTLVPELASSLTDLLPELADTLVAMLPTLLDGAVTLFTALLDALVVIVPMLITTLLSLLPKILGTLLGMLPQLLTTAVSLFLALVKAVLAVLPQLITTLLEMLPVLVTTLLGMLPQLLATGIDLFMTLVDAVIEILPQLIELLIGTVLPDLITTLLEMIPTLLTTAIELFTQLVQALVEVLPELISFLVVTLIPTIVRTLGDAVGKLLEAGKDLIGGLFDGFVDAWKTSMVWFINIPQMLLDALGNVGTILLDAGKAIMQGLFDGLKDVWEDVQGFFSGIGDWIQDHKGPKRYDLKLLVPAGGWIMEGLQSGIEDAVPDLERTLRGVTARIEGVRPNVNVGSALGAFGSRGAGPTVEQNIYPTPGMSEEQVGAMAGRQIAWALG